MAVELCKSYHYLLKAQEKNNSQDFSPVSAGKHQKELFGLKRIPNQPNPWSTPATNTCEKKSKSDNCYERSQGKHREQTFLKGRTGFIQT